MTIFAVEAGWDHSVIGSVSVDVTETTGTLKSYTATIANGRYSHRDISSIMGSGDYSDFATALQSAINSAATAAGGTAGWIVTAPVSGISPMGYDVSAATNFTLAFTGSSGSLMSQIIGIVAGTYVGQADSTLRPYYSIVTAQGGPSGGTDDYEPDGIAEDAEADDGSSYGVARTAAPVYSDFAVRLETQAATFKRHATSAIPWTWRHLFEHARNVEPLLLSLSLDDATWSEQTVALLRADAARFKPTRSVADWDDRWDIDLKTRVEGRL